MELREIAAVDPAEGSLFGGKACGLARLLGASARVPEGFVLGATTLPPECWTEAERAALREAASKLLAGGAVAVRSSAVGEDSAERSFAGLFETFLGLSDIEEVEAAVRSCIASGAAERVLAYAGSDRPLPVAVIVQRQVAARVAGVCFTRDPAGRDGALVIEAVAGCGDALVSGRVEPERWRVYATGLGGRECRCDAAAAKVLDEERVEAIASAATTLSSALGQPLDLEWAFDAEGLWWLQARPITVLREPPSYDVSPGVADADDGPVTVWSNWNVGETMPFPLSPLTWTIWRDSLLPTVAQHLFGAPAGSLEARLLSGVDLVHGRAYFNVNAMLAPPVLGRLMLPLADVMDSRAAASLRRLHEEGVLRPRRLPGHAAARLARWLLGALRSLVRMRIALRPRRALSILAEDAARIAARSPLAGLGDRELVEELQLFATPECARLLFGLQIEAVAMFVYALARSAFAPHPRAQQLIATGIPANPTTRISLGIDELVARARPIAAPLARPLPAPQVLEQLGAVPEARPFLEALRAFLDEFGQRGPTEMDLGAARWVEDPGMVLDLVRLGLREPASAHTGGRMAALAAEREAAVAAALAAETRWRRPVLRALARLVELYMPLREAPKHYGLFVFQRMRQAALELGRRLCERNVLNAPQDVFLLELAELSALAEGEPAPARLQARVEERRVCLARYGSERAPNILRSDGVPVEVVGPAADPDTLLGTGVSAGTASGPVRVLRSADASLVTPGDVLVVEFADPGWTPLFPRAAAVVMEIGGLMCHAAVVARELGVPAVFGVAGATRRLADGERVVVDGEAGTVRRMGARES